MRVFPDGISIESVDRVEQFASGHHAVVEDLNRTKRWRKQQFSPFCLVELKHRSSAPGASGSAAFKLRVSYTSFPGSLACKQQMWGLLSLCNCMTQFPITNLHVCVCVFIHEYIYIGWIYVHTHTHTHSFSEVPSPWLSPHTPSTLLREADPGTPSLFRFLGL